MEAREEKTAGPSQRPGTRTIVGLAMADVYEIYTQKLQIHLNLDGIGPLLMLHRQVCGGIPLSSAVVGR